jgi:hypothetical protein
MYADVSTIVVIVGLLLGAAAILQILIWAIKALIGYRPTLPEEEEQFVIGLRPSDLQELGRQRFQQLLDKELARGAVAEPRGAVGGAKPPSAADSWKH